MSDRGSVISVVCDQSDCEAGAGVGFLCFAGRTHPWLGAAESRVLRVTEEPQPEPGVATVNLLSCHPQLAWSLIDCIYVA